MEARRSNFSDRISRRLVTGTVMRRILIDTETTGLSWRGGDRVCEVAAVEINANYEPVRLVHSYINPQRSVPLEVVRIHGLDDQFLSDKPTFDLIAPEFVRFVRGAELIAHNASFDVGFINHELSLSSFDTLEALGCSVTCSLKLARRTLHARHNRLDDLCQRFQIDNSDRQLHGALKDCLLLAQVLACLERYTVSIMGNNR